MQSHVVADLGQTLEKKKSFLNETEQRYLLAVDLLAAVVFDLDNLPQGSCHWCDV